MGKGSFNELTSTQISVLWFALLATCSQIAGLIAFILIAVLLGQYQGGFSWGSDLKQVFNYHPLFMTLGMIIFYGDAILVYRVFSNVRKFWVKILHATLLASSLIFSAIGLKAVFDSHNRAVPPEANLHTFHSWVGLTVVILFGCQWVCGFVSFLFPQLSDNIRRAYMPSHKFWGKTIFILAIVALCMGIVEYSIFKGFYSDSKLANQRRMINFFGIFVLIFGVIIFYLVDNPVYQRTAETDTEHMPLND